MKRRDDRDGKSKTASAVDAAHYPDPTSSGPDRMQAPTREEIEARAHQLWLEEGQPSGAAERHWLEAERELTATATSRRLVEKAHQEAGSVQR